MTKIIVGIDPGQAGVLATLDSDGWLEVYDLKECIKPTGTFNSVDPELFVNMLARAIDYEYEPEDVAVWIEESSSFHRDGIKTAPPIFDSRGVMRALFYARGYEVNFVAPKVWKKHFGLKKESKEISKSFKEKSVKKACELFPNQTNLFTRPKRGGGTMMLDGRAEAALIAYYGRERNE